MSLPPFFPFSLSFSLSSYLFPPSFPSSFFSLPFRFVFFLFFFQNIAPVSQWGPRLAGSKNEDKEKDRHRVGTRNRGGERRLAHLAGHCESHTECWIGGPERNERGGRHTSPREQQRTAIRHSHRKTRSIFASPLLSSFSFFFIFFFFFNFAYCSSESASFQPGFFRPSPLLEFSPRGSTRWSSSGGLFVSDADGNRWGGVWIPLEWNLIGEVETGDSVFRVVVWLINAEGSLEWSWNENTKCTEDRRSLEDGLIVLKRYNIDFEGRI